MKLVNSTEKEKPYRLMLEYKDGVDRVFYFDTWEKACSYMKKEYSKIDDWDINGY